MFATLLTRYHSHEHPFRKHCLAIHADIEQPATHVDASPLAHGCQSGATSGEHACTLKLALGVAEAACMQLTFDSPAKDGFSMEQVYRGLRKLLVKVFAPTNVPRYIVMHHNQPLAQAVMLLPKTCPVLEDKARCPMVKMDDWPHQGEEASKHGDPRPSFGTTISPRHIDT